MTGKGYWKHIWATNQMKEMVSEAAYPNFEGAKPCDVIQRHIQMSNKIFEDKWG